MLAVPTIVQVDAFTKLSILYIRGVIKTKPENANIRQTNFWLEETLLLKKFIHILD
jgi:hypothetical protein